MPVKKLYIFLPLGQKVVLIRCSKRFSRSGDGRLVYFFLSAAARKSFWRKQCRTKVGGSRATQAASFPL